MMYNVVVHENILVLLKHPLGCCGSHCSERWKPNQALFR